jgi:hypothetical protein
MLEAVLIDVGTSVAQQIFEVKVRERLKSGTIQDYLVRRGHTVLESRKADRQFSQVAEAVASRLSNFLEVEGSTVAESEVEAAVLTVKDCIRAAEIDYQALLDVDLDANALEALILASSDRQHQSAGLSASGEYVFAHVLRECCNYVTEIALQVPDLHGKAFREVLQRETELATLVREVLDRMPIADQAGIEDPDATFELQYRRQLARKLDELQLFGLTVSESIQRYPLTVAYISLALDIEGASEKQGTGEPGEGSEDAETAIVKYPRLVIRGDAGSGKTTLLQWLAVAAARETLELQAEDPTRPIPFFLQLRRYVGRPLPPPSRFLELVTPVLSDALPDGWVTRQLTAGRGLILIDGLDELPAAQRTAVGEWLDELESTYPGCRLIVTSRPSGLTADWVRRGGFTQAELLPMSDPDVESFIDHWHAAAASGISDTAELNELADFRMRLKILVRSTPPLQNLATSPLMCAMLCALHRDRRTQVPSDRLELYRVALETLLDRRDVERKVVVSDFALSLPQKLLLLQDLAYWLLLDDHTDASRADLVDRIRFRLESMRGISASPEEVFDYLLERSGVLREPVVGRIDFLHRTFQEYLGAMEAVAQNHMSLLSGKAVDDQWREVVVLACGRATAAQRKILIMKLLEKGDADRSIKHVMHLMAVACLETAVELEPALVQRIENALRGLVPPSSMADAKALASAGELAVPALQGHKRARVLETSACVRALSLIGGESALRALSEYGSDSRLTVLRELVRAWSRFDLEEYVERVLAKSPRLNSGLELSDLQLIEAGRALPSHARIYAKLSSVGPDLEALRDHVAIRWLTMIGNRNMQDIGAVSSLVELSQLDLERCSQISDFTPLSHLHNLTWLDLSGTMIGPDLRDLPQSGSLRVLRIGRCEKLDALAGIESQANLQTFYVSNYASKKRLIWSGLESLGSLDTVLIHDGSFPGLNSLAASSKLRSLTLDASACTIGAEIADYSALRTLTLSASTGTLPDFFEALKDQESLRHLTIGRHITGDLAWVPPKLQTLTLRESTASALAIEPSGLVSLAIDQAPKLEDLSSLQNLPKLRTLRLGGTSALTDFRPLADLSADCRVYLRGVKRSDLPAGVLEKGNLTILGNSRAFAI